MGKDDISRKRAEKWHPAVRAWWQAVWTSPVATEFLEIDKHSLYMVAELYQDFWTSTTWKDRLAAAAEIRQQGSRFGLSPVDRRRLQWEVEKGEQAAERMMHRERNKQASAKDPRDVLKLDK